jgi:hypothetical protein
MPVRRSQRSTTIAIAIAAAAATSLVPCEASAFFRMGGMGRGMSFFHAGGQAGGFGMGGLRRSTSFQRWPRTAGVAVGNVRHPMPYPEGRGTGGRDGTGGRGGYGGHGYGGRGNGGSSDGTTVIVHNVHPHPSFTSYPSINSPSFDSPSYSSGAGSRNLAASVGP